HLNNAPGLSVARFVDAPLVYTVHHAFDAVMENFYLEFPDVSFVTVSRFQQTKLAMPRIRAVHHGIKLDLDRLPQRKRRYLTFRARNAAPQGRYWAVLVRMKSGVPLKIACEIQPCYRDYCKTAGKAHVDVRFIEYVGDVALAEKNELLGNSLAMMF